jgi:hypothetical protein
MIFILFILSFINHPMKNFASFQTFSISDLHTAAIEGGAVEDINDSSLDVLDIKKGKNDKTPKPKSAIRAKRKA